MTRQRTFLVPIALVLLAAACKGSGVVETTPGPASAAVAVPSPAHRPVPAQIDDLLRAEWQAAKITPAKPTGDAQFFRRIHLDIAGTLPSPEAIRGFLDDRSADKRLKAIDLLLDSPRYAERWTDYWDDVLMGGLVRRQVVDREAFRAWVRSQLEQNTPYDRFVTHLITATGVSSAGGPVRALDDKDAEDPGVSGAVNWLVKYARNPEDLSGAVSRVFLGVQIQCAQCHDHKTENWKMVDFQQFTACFARTRVRRVDGKEKGMIRKLEVHDVHRPAFRVKDNPELAAVAQMKPTAIDGTDLSGSENTRQALAAWMVARTNPYFARAIVNRMWGYFLGRGFVEPVDDFRPSNPPASPAVLDLLAADFVAHGYDLKHLIRSICATEAYQLSSSAPSAGQPPGIHSAWSHFRSRPMPPDVLLDAIVAATQIDPWLEQIAGGRKDALKARMRQQFSFLFDVDEESPAGSFDGTLPQALLLLNGPLVGGGSSVLPGAALSEVLAMAGGDAAKIEALYLRTLSRPPSAAELERWTRYIGETRDAVPAEGGHARPRRQKKAGKGAKAEPLLGLAGRMTSGATTAREQAYEDLFWALLNSTEFVLNH